MAHIDPATQTSPFFEIDYPCEGERIGRIKAQTESREIGALDFCCGLFLEAGPQSRAAGACHTKLDSVETALLYLAACIADARGEDVIMCRTPTEDVSAGDSSPWERFDVRPLLDCYEAVVQC